jgi:hypothetical protein
MEKEEQRFVVKFFSLKGWGSKKIHQKLMNTLVNDTYGLPQITIRLQRFRTRDLSCSDLPRAERPPLTLGRQVEAFLQKYPFANASIIAKHFLRTASTVTETLQRELGTRKFSRHWVAHFLSDAQKVARVEAAKEMSRILQESETNDFDGIATGEESQFQHITASLKMFARSAIHVILRTRQVVGTKTIVIALFVTAKILLVFNVLTSSSTFNQPCFINNIFPDLKTANLNSQRQKTGSTFWVHMNNSMRHDKSEVRSKIKKNHFSRMLHPPYSPDISPGNFWLFGMLK